MKKTYVFGFTCLAITIFSDQSFGQTKADLEKLKSRIEYEKRSQADLKRKLADKHANIERLTPEAEKSKAAVSRAKSIVEENRQFQLNLINMETQLASLANIRDAYRKQFRPTSKIPTPPSTDIPKFSPEEVTKMRPRMSLSWDLMKEFERKDKEYRSKNSKELKAKVAEITLKIQAIARKKSVVQTQVRDKEYRFRTAKIRPDKNAHAEAIAELNEIIEGYDEQIRAQRAKINQLEKQYGE